MADVESSQLRYVPEVDCGPNTPNSSEANWLKSSGIFNFGAGRCVHGYGLPYHLHNTQLAGCEYFRSWVCSKLV